jgi:hypothetical protein
MGKRQDGSVMSIVMMGHVTDQAWARFGGEPNGFFYTPKPYWPAVVGDYGPNALYVNAWNPHSMIGNGNCEDGSVDGVIGRMTNAVALGWPRSNREFAQGTDSIVRVAPLMPNPAQ